MFAVILSSGGWYLGEHMLEADLVVMRKADSVKEQKCMHHNIAEWSTEQLIEHTQVEQSNVEKGSEVEK